MVKIDSDLFSRDIDLVKDELNKRSWLPFITKSMVLRLFINLTNRWLDTYRKQRHEDSEKVLHRMNELEKLYEERELQREEELRNTLYTLKKVFVSSSSKAFCQGVCKERSNWDNGYVCSCNRHSRYVKSIEEQFDSYMEKNVERIIQEYKDSPKWKNQSK